jgi:hypothetical protein
MRDRAGVVIRAGLTGGNIMPAHTPPMWLARGKVMPVCGAQVLQGVARLFITG